MKAAKLCRVFTELLLSDCPVELQCLNYSVDFYRYESIMKSLIVLSR